ncbi:MAG: acyl-CoA dehydrogenase family protein [Cytophagaceae bacterium]
MVKNDIEHILLQAKEVSKTVISEEACKTDKEARWPERSIRALLNAGLGGLVVPEMHGGLGQGLTGLVKVCEIISQQCASTSMCYGMHCVGSAVLSAKATEFQKKNFIEPIVEGKYISTIALSEPGTGAHFYFPHTQLTSMPDGTLKLNGTKSFVTNGEKADIYVISTLALDPTAPPNEFSCVAVEKNTPGMKWGEPWKGMGMRGNSSTNLELYNVKIPADYLLGEKGDQLWYVFNVVAPYFLMAMSGTYLGIAQSAFEEACKHIHSRSYTHSGTSLASAAVIQHRLGSIWAKLERTRSLIYQAASLGDKGEEAAVQFIMAEKAEVGHCVVDIVNEALTLSGGIAYRENSKLELLLRDARAAHIMAPTTDFLYMWIGRSILDQPILGE